jgi:GTP pyrophosphokinase
MRDTIFVLTPQRNVFEFPRGATPIDFAYRVHTDLGHTCRGAKVNGTWVPLDYQLQMGDEVKIVTGRKGGPSRDWLNEDAGFVATSRARQKIRQWFRRQERDKNIAHGRVVVEHVLKRIGAELTLDEVAALFEKHYPEREEFFNAVGLGDVTNVRIENQVREWGAQHAPEPSEGPVDEAVRPTLTSTTTQVQIDDLKDSAQALTRLARCCNPLPGDPIVGYVTRGRGVTIHRRDCVNVQQLVLEEKERLIEVSWGDQEEVLRAQVIVKAYDSPQLLHQISETITQYGEGQISGLRKGRPNRDDIVPLYLTLQVTDLEMLNTLLAELRKIPKVIMAHRQVGG